MMSSPVAASWHCLPPCLRLMILELLLQDGCGLAHFATVSREWQAIIEQHNFARIRVTPARLADFDSMTRRNRALVRTLWLCLELHTYIRSSFANSHADSLRIKTALQDLFLALSTWEPNGELVLDISMYSPSDFRRGFKHLTVEPDLLPNESAQDQSADETTEIGTVRRSAIENIFQFVFLDEPSWLQQELVTAYESELENASYVAGLMESNTEADDELLRAYIGPLETDWPEELPLVPAITGVLLRQQTRRRWMPDTLAEILCRLPRLQDLHYEPWRGWFPGGCEVMDEGK